MLDRYRVAYDPRRHKCKLVFRSLRMLIRRPVLWYLLRAQEFPSHYRPRWVEELAEYMFDKAIGKLQPSDAVIWAYVPAILPQMLAILEFILEYRYLLYKGVCDNTPFATLKQGIGFWHQRAHFLSRALKALDQKYYALLHGAPREARIITVLFRQSDQLGFTQPEDHFIPFHLIGPPLGHKWPDAKTECFHIFATEAHAWERDLILNHLDHTCALIALSGPS
jgi:hypothetical protein